MSSQRYASVYTYPWDVHDETPDGVCATAVERMGVDTVSLAVSYHAAKLILPHNPRRVVYYPEDGAIFFQPEWSAFAGSPIQPHVAGLVAAGDPLRALCDAAERAGLGVIAWAVCLHNTRLGERYPHYAPRNCFGDLAITYLCPAQPAARAYVAAMVRDLAARYPLRAIQLEAAHHMPFVHGFHHEMQQVAVTPALQVLLALCFCDACRALGRDRGLDVEGVRAYVAARVRELLAEGGGDGGTGPLLRDHWRQALDGELSRYMDLRHESTAALLCEARQAVRSVASTPLFLQEASAVGAPPHTPVLDLAWQYGMALPPAPECCDGLAVLGYFSGEERFTTELEAYRAVVPPDLPLEVGLRPCLPDCASAEELRAKVSRCMALGAAGISFYNYGMMPYSAMEWVRDALDGAWRGQ